MLDAATISQAADAPSDTIIFAYHGGYQYYGFILAAYKAVLRLLAGTLIS